MKRSKTRTKKAASPRPRTESKRAVRAKQTAFLNAYRETGTITSALRLAKSDRATYRGWLEADLTFSTRVEEVWEELADELEEELRRRALRGVDEPVYYRGEKIGVVTRRSEAALMLLLKAKRLEFRERAEISSDPIPIDPSRLTADELDQLRALTRKVTGRDEETEGQS